LKKRDSLSFFRQKRIDIIDNLPIQIQELFVINNPGLVDLDRNNLRLKENAFVNKYLKTNSFDYWAWYPWKNILIRLLNRSDLFKVRTSRNRELVTLTEQKKFYDFPVAVAGLSVGFGIAGAIKMHGGARSISVSDFDLLSLSNLNRVRLGMTDLGLKKSELARRMIYEIDPYSKVNVFDDGITQKNIELFISGSKIIFDEVDDMKTKLLLRQVAIKKKIPLLMLTDNDDGVLIDYYPYNKGYSRYFNGVDNRQVSRLILSSDKSKQTVKKIGELIIGRKYVSSWMLRSLQSVGKTINTWPQLGTAATAAASVGAQITRKISLGQYPKQQRWLVKI